MSVPTRLDSLKAAWPLLREDIARLYNGAAWPEEYVEIDLAVMLDDASPKAPRPVALPGSPSLAKRWGRPRSWVSRRLRRLGDVRWTVKRARNATVGRGHAVSSGRAVSEQSVSSDRAVSEQSHAGRTPGTGRGRAVSEQSVSSDRAVSEQSVRSQHARVETGSRLSAPGSRLPAVYVSQTPPAVDVPEPKITGPTEPPVPAWARKRFAGQPAAEKVALIAAVIRELRQREPQPRELKSDTNARSLEGVWKAVGRPPLDAFQAEVVLVAKAFRESPEPIFARDVRAEGWKGGTNRSRSLKTLCVLESWSDRLDTAQRWEAGGAMAARRKGEHRPAVRNVPSRPVDDPVAEIARIRARREEERMRRNPRLRAARQRRETR